MIDNEASVAVERLKVLKQGNPANIPAKIEGDRLIKRFQGYLTPELQESLSTSWRNWKISQDNGEFNQAITDVDAFVKAKIG